MDGATGDYKATTQVVYGNTEADLASGTKVDFPNTPLERTA